MIWVSARYCVIVEVKRYEQIISSIFQRRGGKISEIDNDELLLNITMDCVGVVTSKINSMEVKEIEEYELDVVVVEKRDDICTLETLLGLQVHLRAVYSKNLKAVTSVEIDDIDDIDDYNCHYCPY